MLLFVAQGFGGIQVGGAVRGEDPEDQADEAGNAERDHDRDRRNRNSDIGKELHAQAESRRRPEFRCTPPERLTIIASARN